jgi:hypothetical protein
LKIFGSSKNAFFGRIITPQEKNKKLLRGRRKLGEKTIHGPRGVLEGKSVSRERAILHAKVC